jgi:hypothetical protein
MRQEMDRAREALGGDQRVQEFDGRLALAKQGA